MKKVICAGLLLGAVGCANLDVQPIKSDDGRFLGYLATYEHTRDFGGWHSGAIVYDAKGQYISHRAAGVGALLPEAIKAGAIVGGGYFIGKGGDTLTSSANADADASIHIKQPKQHGYGD